MDNHTFDGISRSLATGTSRRQALKLLGGGIASGLVLTTGLKGVAAKPAPSGGTLSFPVNYADPTGAFAGTFDVTQFAVQGGQVNALGTLVGTVTDAVGDLLGDITQALSLPVTGATSGDCEILNLVLGPLDLNLLGLMVHLDQVVLNITAQQGGGLLGDLLCAIANLLSGNGNALGRLSNLLNQVLGAL